MKDSCGFNKFIRIIGIILFALGIITLLVYDYHDVPQYTYTYLGRGSRDMTKEISDGVMIMEEVPYYADDLGLSFIFTTFGHRVFGDVTVRAVGEKSGFVYFDRMIPGKEIKSNEYVDFLFPKERPKEEDTIAVYFTSTCEPGGGLALFTSGEDSIPNLKLTVDGEEAKTDVMVRRIVTYSFLQVILATVLVWGLIAAAILKLWKPPLETVYVVLALFLGTLYLFIMTPLAIPDEQTHYQTSYFLTNLILSDDPRIGDAQYFDYSGWHLHYNVSSGYDRIMTDFFMDSAPETTRKIPQYKLSYPLMYLPQAAGISIGRLFRLNIMQTFYLGRFCNLLFFVICAFFAVRITPRFKLLFCMLGLMPMALHQAASYSYDTFINGLAFLFIALILKLADGEGRISFAEILPSVLTGVLLCPAKPVYAPMMLLFLLIPVRRFGSLKKISRRFYRNHFPCRSFDIDIPIRQHFGADIHSG